jgi:hypothetical protein
MVWQKDRPRKGRRDVRFGSKADICAAISHVRFTPNSDRKSRHVPRKWSCPLCPSKRTCAVQQLMSALGQKRTLHVVLFDHFVGAGEECGRHGEAKHLGSLAVKNQFELCGLLDWWRRDAHDACTI